MGDRETHPEFYEDAKGEHRWRLRASNGPIIADSGQGYNDKVDAEHGLALVKAWALREAARDAEVGPPGVVLGEN